MLEALRKKSFKSSLIFTVICLAAGAFLTVYFVRDVVSTVADYETFEELEPDEIRNQLVKIDVTANFGCYMEEYSEDTSTHRRTTTYLYYVIWTGDDYATDFRYMTIKVPAKFESEMEAIAENTYNEIYSDPQRFVGKIRRLSSEEYEYFIEYFTAAGWTETDIEDMTLPYYIDVTGTSVSLGSSGVYILLFAAGILLVVYGVYRLIKGAKGGYLKKFTKSCEEAGYSETSIDSDLRTAVSFTKNGSIKAGRLCLYFNLNSTVPHAVPCSKIIWAYQNTTTHRTNGIKTGVTYSLMIYTENNKNAMSFSVPSEAVAQDVLKRMVETLPWVVVGYSEELKRLFNKERGKFLDIRYNKVEHIAVEPGFEGYNTLSEGSGNNGQ